MAATGADALHVDQRNDLARTRRLLGPDAVILGNFDPVATLSLGTPAAIADSVQQIIAAGANAIWPGCDLWPEIPDENFRALMHAAHAFATHCELSCGSDFENQEFFPEMSNDAEIIPRKIRRR